MIRYNKQNITAKRAITRLLFFVQKFAGTLYIGLVNVANIRLLAKTHTPNSLWLLSAFLQKTPTKSSYFLVIRVLN